GCLKNTSQMPAPSAAINRILFIPYPSCPFRRRRKYRIFSLFACNKPRCWMFCPFLNYPLALFVETRPLHATGIIMTLHAGRLICAIGILALLSACSSEDAAALQAEARAIPVLTAVVEKQTIADRIEAVGSTRASESITIAARVSNIVTRIGFEEGALV